MAVGGLIAAWGGRADWSGESPSAGATLLQRFETLDGVGATRALPDSANPARDWTLRNASAATAGLSGGRWGNNLGFNRSNPATEQTSLVVPHFAGMWPDSGQMLFKVWAALNFSMSFTPIISTRNTSGAAPLVYLSTLGDGRPRAMVYNAAGSSVLDQSESVGDIGWTPVANEWVCYLWLVDMDAETSQLGLVRRDTGETFVGAVRSLSGAPNAACAADFEVGTLSPTASYWAGGYIDEVGYWQTSGADMATIVDEVKRGLPARGADSSLGAGLSVTDAGVEAEASATLLTGAQPAAWTTAPAVDVQPGAAAQPSAILSDDGGDTWDAPVDLPDEFTGLVRWSLPLSVGETVEAIELREDAPPPEIDPGGTLTAEQGETATATITGTWAGTPTFTASAPPGISVTFDGTEMTVQAGWAIGDYPILVTVVDMHGGSASTIWTLTVELPDAPDIPNPVYAEAPLILYNALDERAEILADPLSAVLAHEINGEQTLTFTMPETHRIRHLVRVERIVEVAGELYRVRRVTSFRDGGVPLIEVYCEARFYDLGTAGQFDGREFSGVQPGTVIAQILEGTGWAIGRINVSTVRTWEIEDCSPLAALREVARVHGGDLVFDNTSRKVSLLTFAGRRTGLTFFYGHGVAGAKRVEDTTTLVTRIYARNADGLTIADVNNGLPYIEDFTWTDEIKSAVYDFQAGTNPFTMLSMAIAALGKRAKPHISYELEMVDLSAWSGQDLDRFAVGDEVRVVDAEMGINTLDRIVRLEYDLLRPWASKVVMSEKLRQLGAEESAEAGLLTTGTDIDTRDMVPFNLLLNARFDNGLAHWAASGVTVVPEGHTGPNAVQMAGGGTRWIEQTVAPDTRDTYTLSLVMEAQGWPEGLTPELAVVAEIVYDDGTVETIEQKVS